MTNPFDNLPERTQIRIENWCNDQVRIEIWAGSRLLADKIVHHSQIGNAIDIMAEDYIYEQN